MYTFSSGIVISLLICLHLHEVLDLWLRFIAYSWQLHMINTCVLRVLWVGNGTFENMLAYDVN